MRPEQKLDRMTNTVAYVMGLRMERFLEVAFMVGAKKGVVFETRWDITEVRER